MNKIIIKIFLLSSLLTIQLFANNNQLESTLEALSDEYYIDNNNRTYIAHQNIDSNTDTTGATTIGYDYIIDDGDIKPFIGAMVGFSSYISDHNIDIADTIYGAQAGINYSIDESFSLDAGYRFIKSSMNDTVIINNTPVKLEIDNVRDAYVGVKYSFHF